MQGTERRWVSDSCRVQDLGTDVSRRTAEAGRVEMMELSASGEIAADVEGADPNGAESAETSAVPSFPTSTEARSTRQPCSLLQGTMVGQRYVLWVEGGLPASRRADFKGQCGEQSPRSWGSTASTRLSRAGLELEIATFEDAHGRVWWVCCRSVGNVGAWMFRKGIRALLRRIRVGKGRETRQVHSWLDEPIA